MKTIIRNLLLVAWAFSSVFAVLAFQEAGTSSTPADNTTANQRDRNKSESTAERQNDNRSDLDLTKQIRRALLKDKSLSTNAHNVKIISQNGMVTLKGPVNSDTEKQAVEAKAAEIAGAEKVSNELQVSPK